MCAIFSPEILQAGAVKGLMAVGIHIPVLPWSSDHSSDTPTPHDLSKSTHTSL